MICNLQFKLGRSTCNLNRIICLFYWIAVENIFWSIKWTIEYSSSWGSGFRIIGNVNKKDPKTVSTKKKAKIVFDRRKNFTEPPNEPNQQKLIRTYRTDSVKFRFDRTTEPNHRLNTRPKIDSLQNSLLVSISPPGYQFIFWTAHHISCL